MKSNDLLEKKSIDEDLKSKIGGAVNWLKNKMTSPDSELTTLDQKHKEMFITNFISAAYKALNSEISSGRVDPNLSGSEANPAATPAQPPKEEPPAPSAEPTTPASAGPKKAPGNAQAPGASQRQTSQNINNYVQGLAKSLNSEPDKGKKMALAKELVNFMADRKDYPEWQNALATAQQVIKKGVPDPNFANSAITRLKAGQMMEAWQVYWINKLLESIGFTFKDLGLTLLKENVKNGKYILAETKYYKLNMIFESMITEAESIEQWLKRWLPTYLRGTKMDDQHTQTLIKQVQNTYSVDKGKSALQKLANAAFAASQAGGYGASDAAPAQSVPNAGTAANTSGSVANRPSSAGAEPTKTGTSTNTILNSIQSLLAKLKSNDPALYAQIIKKIGAGESLQGLPSVTPTPAQVSESSRKNKK